MNASKENAAEAMKKLNSVWDRLPEDFNETHGDVFKFLSEFLEVAFKKLPAEKSFKTDAERRKAKPKPKK